MNTIFGFNIEKKNKWADDNFPPQRRKPYVAIFVMITSLLATHLVLGKFDRSIFVSWFQQKWNLFETLSVFEYVMLTEHLLVFYALLFVLAAVTYDANRIVVAVLVCFNLLALGVSFAYGGQARGYGNYQTIIAIVMVANTIVSLAWEMRKRDIDQQR